MIPAEDAERPLLVEQMQRGEVTCRVASTTEVRLGREVLIDSGARCCMIGKGLADESGAKVYPTLRLLQGGGGKWCSGKDLWNFHWYQRKQKAHRMMIPRKPPHHHGGLWAAETGHAFGRRV
mmetsp:Transcript_87369/g.199531  ORF Transcript_87369/g.199531 Transcript_87369/m.199531 type:complete len:122 (-) Transcript_87369:2441-2806(-)